MRHENELWCGITAEHTRHLWVGHHGRDFSCPGADGVEHPEQLTWPGGLIVGFDTAMPEDTIVFVTPTWVTTDADLEEAGEPVSAGGYARLRIPAGGWGTVDDGRGVAGRLQPAEGRARRTGPVAGALASDVSPIIDRKGLHVVRLIEFLSACVAVGGAGVKGYIRWLRFRKKYRGRR